VSKLNEKSEGMRSRYAHDGEKTATLLCVAATLLVLFPRATSVALVFVFAFASGVNAKWNARKIPEWIMSVLNLLVLPALAIWGVSRF
jgi:hypothetical protein